MESRLAGTLDAKHRTWAGSALDFPVRRVKNRAVPRVELEHVEKVFGGPKPVPALEDVSLSVQSGELLVLLGPSGCGKTTTLRLVAGLDEPTSGSIRIGGRVVNGVPPKDRDVAMVFQNPALYPHLSAFDNLAFGLRLRRLHRQTIEQRVRQTAEMLGLAGCLDRKPMALSGGQQQRVALGRALVRQPGVLLLDEPLSSLDAPTRAHMRRELAALQRGLGATMLYVTHDQHEAMTLGQRIAVMDQARIQQIGSPAQIYQEPANLFVAEFIGAPPMNLLAGTIENQSGEIAFRAQPGAGRPASEALILPLNAPLSMMLAPLEGKQVVLGLRPEHMFAVTSSGGAQGGPGAEGVVESLEWFGPNGYVRLRSAGGILLTAQLRPDVGLCVGERIAVEFDLSSARLFDPTSGLALAGSPVQ